MHWSTFQQCESQVRTVLYKCRSERLLLPPKNSLHVQLERGWSIPGNVEESWIMPSEAILRPTYLRAATSVQGFAVPFSPSRRGLDSAIYTFILLISFSFRSVLKWNLPKTQWNWLFSRQLPCPITLIWVWILTYGSHFWDNFMPSDGHNITLNLWT